MQEEKRIAYKAGITRSPSDFLSKDGELAECINLTVDNDELKPAHLPQDLYGGHPLETSDGEKLSLLFVHIFGGFTHYICKNASNNKLYWIDVVDDNLSEATEINYPGDVEIISINAIGAYLICSTNDTMRIFRWYNHQYQYLGDKLPKPELSLTLRSIDDQIDVDPVNVGAYLRNTDYHYKNNKVLYLMYDDDNKFVGTKRYSDAPTLKEKWVKVLEPQMDEDKDQKKSFQDETIGHVSSVIHDYKKAGGLLYPFWVRYALHLVDGSYMNISAPILCLPNIRGNDKLAPVRKFDDGWRYWHYDEHDVEPTGWFYQLYAEAYTLYVSASIPDFEKWKNLISGISIFYSEEVRPFDIEDKWEFSVPDGKTSNIMWDGVTERKYKILKQDLLTYEDYFKKSTKDWSEYVPEEEWNSSDRDGVRKGVDELLFSPIMTNQKPDYKIIRELLTKTQFYRVADLDVDFINKGEHDIRDFYEKDVLLNLTTQLVLDRDTWYDFDKITTKQLEVYNSRLQLYGAKITPFAGYKQFMVNQQLNIHPGYFSYYVKIEGNKGYIYVKQEIGFNPTLVPTWFYYPNIKAKELIIRNEDQGEEWIIHLKEHPGLNGAYTFLELPSDNHKTYWERNDNDPITDAEDAGEPMVEYDEVTNQIWESSVGNPFVFSSKNVSTITNITEILGVTQNTADLTQETFGISPLICFTPQGIWGLSLKADGTYEAKQMISRDIMIESAGICKTDKQILFVSKKGLMLIADGQIANVSQQMNGDNFIATSLEDVMQKKFDSNLEIGMLGKCCDTTSFRQFIQGCFMSYDYIDNQILLLNKEYEYCYAYNTLTGAITKLYLGYKVDHSVNDFPDWLLQDDRGCLHSLYWKRDEEEIKDKQLCFMATRPFKLESATEVKSLQQMQHYGYFKDSDSVTCKVYTSDDLINWYPKDSRYGAAFKFMRLAFYLKMTPQERLSGTILTVDNKRNNKIR